MFSLITNKHNDNYFLAIHLFVSLVINIYPPSTIKIIFLWFLHLFFPQSFLNPLIFSFQYSLHQDFSCFCDIQLPNQSLFNLYFIWPIAFKMLETSCFAEIPLLLGLMTSLTSLSSPFQSVFRTLFFLELFLTQTFFMLYTRTVSYLIHIQ